jgi:hypothetical protein
MYGQRHRIVSITYSVLQFAVYSFGWWLMAGADFFERKVLLADCWWLVCSERKVLLAGRWLISRTNKLLI